MGVHRRLFAEICRVVTKDFLGVRTYLCTYAGADIHGDFFPVLIV